MVHNLVTAASLLLWLAAIAFRVLHRGWPTRGMRPPHAHPPRPHSPQPDTPHLSDHPTPPPAGPARPHRSDHAR